MRRTVQYYVLPLAFVGVNLAATHCFAQEDSSTSFSQIMKQRSSQLINPQFSVSIGDITGNAVDVSLLDSFHNVSSTTQSVANNNSTTLSLRSKIYLIKVSDMVNNLIGEDFARISVEKIHSAHSVAIDSMTPEALIEYVRGDTTNQYERNGVRYSGKDAAAHLEYKLGNNKTMSAKDFIDQIATRSSTTGQDYFLITPNGTRIRLADHLTEFTRKSGIHANPPTASSTSTSIGTR